MNLTPLEEEALVLAIDVESPMAIRHVFIESDLRTRTSVIERQLSAAYSARTFAGVYTALHDAERRFKGMGLFNALEITCVPAEGGSGNEVDLVIRAEEKSAGVGGGSVHTDPVDGQITASINGKLRGALGFGTILAGSVDWKGRDVSDAFSVELSKVHPFASETAASLKLHSETINCRSEASYDLKSAGVTARVSTVDRRHEVAYTAAARQIIAMEHSELSELRPASARVLDEMGLVSLKSSIAYTLRLDTRDSNLVPTKGGLLKVHTEFAGPGGNARFLKSALNAQIALPIGGTGAVLALRAMASGVLHPTDVATRSIADRVFLGGIGQMRGFSARGVGGECQPNGDGVRLCCALFSRTQRHKAPCVWRCAALPVCCSKTHTTRSLSLSLSLSCLLSLSLSCLLSLSLPHSLALSSLSLFSLSRSPCVANAHRRGQFDRLGGDLAASGSAMIHFPLPLPILRDIGMRGCFHASGGSLVDIGRAGNTPIDALRTSVSNLGGTMRYSAGAGLLAATPFGRLDISYSHIFHALACDVQRKWQFGISAGD